MPTLANANAATKAEIAAIVSGKGIITVVGNTATTRYVCVADGVADDRPTILLALTAAADDLPARVTFSPGDYGISGGLEIKPPQGSRGLTIEGSNPNLTRIRFNGSGRLTPLRFIAFKIIPSVLPTVGAYADYLSDIRVTGIEFYDDNPLGHTSADQSHGVSIQYCKNAVIDNCTSTDIGDEAFNFTHVRSGRIINNTTINTPSYGYGGGPISIQHGCSDIVITGNTLLGSSNFGTPSSFAHSRGIHVEILDSAGIEGLHIVGNTIRDFFDVGLLLNSSAAADIVNCEIVGNTIDNCGFGIAKIGSAGNLRNCVIAGNTITNVRNIGIEFDAGKSNTKDIIITDNNIDTCAIAAMKLQVTRANLSNNVIKNCPRGLHIFDGEDINITGGIFDSCGGSVLEEIEVETGTNIAVNSVSIFNSSASSACIKGVPEVRNCNMERTNATNPENMIYNAVNVRGCTLQGGIRLHPTSTHGVISNNKISFSDTGGANTAPGIIVADGNDDYVISGNAIDLSGSTNNQYCIDIQAGASNTLVTGNNLKAKTAGTGNALNDAGTGTKADMVNNNITT